MKELILLLAVAKFGSSAAAACNGMEGLCDLKFDQVTFPGTHNSGAGFDGVLKYAIGLPALSCFYRCQSKSYDGQLAFGIRFFDIDVCWRKKKMVNYHNNAYTGSILKGFNQLANWLNKPENKNEVIAIRISDVKDVNSGNVQHLLNDALTAFPGTNGKTGLNNIWSTTYNWPTLGQAVNENKRVFFFIGGQCDSGCRSRNNWVIQRGYMRDTWISRGVTSSCSGIIPDTRKKCKAYAKSELVLHSNIASYGLCVSEMAQVCDNNLIAATDACEAERKAAGKTVNFIIVDYPEKSPNNEKVTTVARNMNKKNMERYFEK